jgi:hypothetical protein
MSVTGAASNGAALKQTKAMSSDHTASTRPGSENDMRRLSFLGQSETSQVEQS